MGPPPEAAVPAAAAIAGTTTVAMAAQILADDPIIERRNVFSEEILTLWQELQGKPLYAIMCPNGVDYGCMAAEDIPRLRVTTCHFPGELDYFTVVQPFQEHG